MRRAPEGPKKSRCLSGSLDFANALVLKDRIKAKGAGFPIGSFGNDVFVNKEEGSRSLTLIIILLQLKLNFSSSPLFKRGQRDFERNCKP
jgi:hypothetical protein